MNTFDEGLDNHVLNEVRDGDYDVMPLSMSYLQRKFGA